jgi:isopenicillin-N epimerase
MNQIRNLFLLDPDVIYLNHGSFGATPRQVLDVYQHWQRRIENQPVKFLSSEIFDHLERSRQVLGNYLHSPPDCLAFVPNATFGVNIVARSLRLKPGDEILTSDHEYGACLNAWEFVCQHSGASLIRQPVPLPLSNPDDISSHLLSAVTTRTKLIFLSHITSPTAICFPVEQICNYARNLGILSFIDGAHAPGQIDLDLLEIGADFYTGNCHKWMMAPKGSGFLFVRTELQDLIDPLVVSWGWGTDYEHSSGSRFLDYLQWWGTHDPSAFLTVPAAIDFQNQYHWPEIRKDCHQLAIATRKKIDSITRLDPVCPDSTSWINQMFVNRLPTCIESNLLKKKLLEDFKIEIPLITWNDQKFIRTSIQGYNTERDTASLLYALESIFT